MIMQTQPDKISWHVLQDHELDELAGAGRPIVLGLATTFLGAVIGLFTAALTSGAKLSSSEELSAGDVQAIVIFWVCVAVTLTLGFFAVKAQLDLRARLREIRSRKARQIEPTASYSRAPKARP